MHLLQQHEPGDAERIGSPCTCCLGINIHIASLWLSDKMHPHKALVPDTHSCST